LDCQFVDVFERLELLVGLDRGQERDQFADLEGGEHHAEDSVACDDDLAWHGLGRPDVAPAECGHCAFVRILADAD